MIFSYYNDELVAPDKGGILGYFSGEREWNNIRELHQLLRSSHGVVGRFSQGKRSNDTFLGTNCLVFDFDKGKNDFNEIHEQLKGTKHLIMASKNHEKDKGDGKGVIQRFHLYLPLEKEITDILFYKFLWKRMTDRGWEADNASSSPVQYFYKHHKTLAADDGVLFSYEDYARAYEWQKEKEKQKPIKTKNEGQRSANYVKKSIETYLSNHPDPGPGERTAWAIKFSGFMRKCLQQDARTAEILLLGWLSSIGVSVTETERKWAEGIVAWYDKGGK